MKFKLNSKQNSKKLNLDKSDLSMLIREFLRGDKIRIDSLIECPFCGEKLNLWLDPKKIKTLTRCHECRKDIVKEITSNIIIDLDIKIKKVL